MKDKIKYLVLGILIGAVITAGVFLIFKKDKPNFPKNGMPKGMPDMEQFEGMDFKDFKDFKGGPSKRQENQAENSKGTSTPTEGQAADTSNTPATDASSTPAAQ